MADKEQGVGSRKKLKTEKLKCGGGKEK